MANDVADVKKTRETQVMPANYILLLTENAGYKKQNTLVRSFRVDNKDAKSMKL